MARHPEFNKIRDAAQRPIWFVIASGPSLLKADIEVIREFRENNPQAGCIAINNCYQLCPWADVLYGCDREWWEYYKPDFDGYKLSWSSTNYAVQVPYERGVGLGKTRVRAGGNSGYQATNLAYLFGAKHIILTGFDMQRTGGAMHWHKDHGGKLKNNGNLKRWRANFLKMASDLEKEGVRCINATRETALTCFERMPIDQAIEIVRGSDLRGQGVLHPKSRRGSGVAG